MCTSDFILLHEVIPTLWTFKDIAIFSAISFRCTYQRFGCLLGLTWPILMLVRTPNTHSRKIEKSIVVENRFPQERISVQKLWSRYEKWSSLVTLNGCKIVLDPKSKFLTNFVKFQIGVKWIVLCEKRKKRGFFEKKSEIFMNIDDIENLSLWIENWCLGGHFKPLSIFELNLNLFRKMFFFFWIFTVFFCKRGHLR